MWLPISPLPFLDQIKGREVLLVYARYDLTFPVVLDEGFRLGAYYPSSGNLGDAISQGRADAGVVIHEGQLTYGDLGLRKVVDLGEWWKGETGLPLPLGGNGIRRDLDPDLKRRLCRLLTESISYGLDHRQEALGYATRYARGLEDDPVRSDRFVGMYVNDWTRDYGEAGRRAVQLLLDRGFAAGILPRNVKAELLQE